MAYYHDLITEKSWQLLQELQRRHRFILIGGWAVYLFTKNLKSKDIDIVCDYPELEKLKAHHPLLKNERLRKYEIKTGEVDIDIYVPFFSNLGVPVEEIGENTLIVEGFRLPEKELLLILKQKAWHDRGHSLKGEKDKIDIIGLLATGLNFKKYLGFLEQFKLKHYSVELIFLIREISSLPELNLNVHQFSRLKKQVLAELAAAVKVLAKKRS